MILENNIFFYFVVSLSTWQYLTPLTTEQLIRLRMEKYPYSKSTKILHWLSIQQRYYLIISFIPIVSSNYFNFSCFSSFILKSHIFQSIGIQTINMDSHVLSEGDSRKHIILGLIWQILAVS